MLGIISREVLPYFLFVFTYLLSVILHTSIFPGWYRFTPISKFLRHTPALSHISLIRHVSMWSPSISKLCRHFPRMVWVICGPAIKLVFHAMARCSHINAMRCSSSSVVATGRTYIFWDAYRCNGIGQESGQMLIMNRFVGKIDSFGTHNDGPKTRGWKWTHAGLVYCLARAWWCISKWFHICSNVPIKRNETVILGMEILSVEILCVKLFRPRNSLFLLNRFNY